ncbi:MAG: glycosyltransferase family 4 protein [Acidobacteriota bacterium]
MKILYAAGDFPAEPLNGCHWFAYNLINCMARSHECHLISLAMPGRAACVREWERCLPGLRVLDVLPVRHRQLVRWSKGANYITNLRIPHLVQWMTPGFTRALRRVVRETSYDLVHFTDITLVFYRNLVRGSPVVISGPDPASLHLRGNMPFEPSFAKRVKLATTARAYGNIERTHLKTFSAVHVVSEADAEHLRRSAGLKNVTVINHAVDPRFFAVPIEACGDEDAVTMFSSGSFSVPYIRTPFMSFFERHWDAIRRCRPAARWVVAGPGAPADVKKRLTAAPGVEYHEWIHDYDGALFRSDIAVFLDGSGTGMKTRVLQAMGAGKAVVGTPFAFTGLEVKHGVQGFIADGHDSLMRALVALIESPRLRREIGGAAREHVRARFTLEITGRKWDALYERMLRQHRDTRL